MTNNLSLILPTHLQKEIDKRAAENAGNKYRILTVFYGKADAEEPQVVGAEIFLSDNTFDDVREQYRTTFN